MTVLVASDYRAKLVVVLAAQLWAQQNPVSAMSKSFDKEREMFREPYLEMAEKLVKKWEDQH